MKTIYECSQSKGIKWFTLIFFVIVSLAILVHLFRFIMSQDCYVGCAGTDQPVADIGLKNSEGENPSPFHKRKYDSSDHRGVSTSA